MTMQLEVPENALTDKETQPFTALCFTTRTTLQMMATHQHVPQELYSEAERLGLTPAGPVQYIYTDVTGNETSEFGLEIALPVATTDERPFGFTYKTFGSFRCVSYTFVGPWSEFMAVYDLLFDTFHQVGYHTDGRLREVYSIVDVNNPESCVTEIQIGLV